MAMPQQRRRNHATSAAAGWRRWYGVGGLVYTLVPVPRGSRRGSGIGHKELGSDQLKAPLTRRFHLVAGAGGNREIALMRSSW